ncbi:MULTISPECIES: NAD(P)-binding domain-containing protein [unclassified Pseudoalteromonas]|uniref:NAD(P)-binding domain-containing protein n=1 Tax=unclassified Pseudoalteromonas TaxID=194690 RepID=UPI00209815B2|nr:NAD(P)-binding domain-containing protein [Pseudoalteromonas sp. XMcav2-N]MCO7187462.1 NAD(P)-binding domain-containing protein [Pseudoalteromonas sp. XMcav2-N]
MNSQAMQAPSHPMKRVAVIGAGLSGLVTTKELIDQSHTVVCFERSDDIGGAFYNKENEGGIYNDIHLTVSNFFMAFSSFPPREKNRKYWTASEYIEYLQDFTEHFRLRKFIRFNTVIESVEPVGTQKWRVTYFKNGERKEELFDSVAVCSGKFRNPLLPSVPNMEQFKGTIHHSFDFKEASKFKGKKVVCLGLGESGSDVVHQIAQVAQETHLVVKRPKSIIARVILGDTGDSRTTRAAHYSFLVNHSLFEATLKKRIMNKGLKVNEQKRQRPLSAFWMWKFLVKYGLHGEFSNKNDIWLQDLETGQTQLHLFSVKRFAENGVYLHDGQFIECTDVMMSTGYETQFDMIHHSAAQDAAKNIRSNFLHMIHPTLRDSLVWIGFARPDVGGVPTIAELQARLYARVLAGKTELADSHTLQRRIEEYQQECREQFCLEPDRSENVRYYRFTGELARTLGVEPKWYHLLPDPRLIFNFYHGSLVAAQFRLSGPGKDPEAAKAMIRRVGLMQVPTWHKFFFFGLTSALSLIAPVVRKVVKMLKMQDHNWNDYKQFRCVADILAHQWPSGQAFPLNKTGTLAELFSQTYEYEGFKFFLHSEYEVPLRLLSPSASIKDIDDFLRFQEGAAPLEEKT